MQSIDNVHDMSMLTLPKSGQEFNLDSSFGKLPNVHMWRSSITYSRELKTLMNKLFITWETEDLPPGAGHFSDQGSTVMLWRMGSVSVGIA